MITGMAVITEPSAIVLARDHVIYRGPLAVHLITLELLLIWFPFGKLMHAFLFAFSRGATGRRSARISAHLLSKVERSKRLPKMLLLVDALIDHLYNPPSLLPERGAEMLQE